MLRKGDVHAKKRQFAHSWLHKPTGWNEPSAEQGHSFYMEVISWRALATKVSPGCQFAHRQQSQPAAAQAMG